MNRSRPRSREDQHIYYVEAALSGQGQHLANQAQHLVDSIPAERGMAPPPPPFPGTGFNAELFANSSEFAVDNTIHLDWENIDRKSTGTSVIDISSVYDDSGRSFHGYKSGKYFFPNDPTEQDRLDLQHAGLLLLLNGKLGNAPVKDPKFVLDLATGTGIWAMEYAQQHPDAQVIGTDLSDIQPKFQLPNCSFMVDDAEDEWLFGSSDEPIKFDYIHLRFVFSCFDEPRKVVSQAFKNLQPGGWMEYLESSMEFHSIDNNIEGTALKQWAELSYQGLAKKGRDARVAKNYAQWMRDEGFVDVHEEILICPGNHWPEDRRLKRCGRYMLANCHQGFRGNAWKLFKECGLASDEIETLVSDAKNDAANRKYRWFWPVYVVYGRRPFEWEVATSSTGSQTETMMSNIHYS
ncbi:uncharacterized protein JN550_006650 [Neoarthrinium moseri]|uniref:uncharacterized protein n=1 Tax=Neoarthrinium moseri TaxID=1658444 RepID=UPI001FDBCC58|nr:uncharacterized protein JN550_006650 [Neoarthrinium moseri]KAI1867843.1 hypothetical protein JN550_006650 [Neoarthrinium moseri]